MSTTNRPQPQTGMPWRLLGWGAAVALLALPFAAMQLQVEGVKWSPGDFLFAALLFGIVGLLLELAVRASPSWHFRAGVGLAVLAGFVLVWVNLAVGILGSEDNDANLLFVVTPAIAFLGSAVARFRAAGMAAAMAVSGMAVLAVPLIACDFGIGEARALTKFDYPTFLPLFAMLWFGAAVLLARAARTQPSS